MEADLLRYYGVDLLDLYRGVLSVRRLGVLVRGLPPQSATVQAAEPDTRWSLTDHLLAAVVDELRLGNWLQSKDGHANRNRPQPIPRPGVAGRETVKWGNARGVPQGVVRARLAARGPKRTSDQGKVVAGGD